MASSLGWLCLLSFSPFLSLSSPTFLSPSLSSEIKLAFLSLDSFISQVRREQDAGDRATPVWMERHWMWKEPSLPPAPRKLWAEAPSPLSVCSFCCPVWAPGPSCSEHLSYVVSPHSALAAPGLSSAQADLQLPWSTAPFVHLQPPAKAPRAL